MFFCLYGAFLENSLSTQNFPSPHMPAVCMQGEGESLSYFSKALAALCMALLRRSKIMLGACWEGIPMLSIFTGPETQVAPYLNCIRWQWLSVAAAVVSHGEIPNVYNDSTLKREYCHNVL